MKKKLLFLVLLIPLFAACGNDNQLICYEELNGGEYKQSLIMNYNKEKTQVKDASIEVVVDIDKTDIKDLGCTKETIEDCIDELEAKFNNGCNGMLANCKTVEKTSSKIVFTADIKEDKMEEYFGEISTTLPINQMRSKIETKFGFTCE